MFPSFDHPVRGCRSWNVDSQSAIFVYLPVKGQSINILIKYHLSNQSIRRNSFVNDSIRKRACDDACTIWAGILGTNVALDIKLCGNQIQYFCHLFTDLYTVTHIFGRLYDDGFSSQVFRQYHTACSFSSFLGCFLLS